MDEKVLVVEDDETLLETLEYNLTRQGFQVSTATDDLAALDVTRQEHPDLIKQQAGRASDYTAFFMMNEDRAGYLAEYGATLQIVTNPKEKQTEDYISGRFG